MTRQMAIKVALLLCMVMAAGVQAPARQRVLVMAEEGGQHVAFTQRGLRWLQAKAGEMDLELTTVSDCKTLKAGDIASYDLVIQLNYPPYMWSDEASREFEQAIDNGTVAWVGFHHASLLGEFDGYGMWQWFSDFLGGIRFKNYIAEKADGEMTVEDPGHPVMAGVSPTFIVREDEWYTYDRNPRPQVHVLASVDERSYSPASSIRMGDHPVVWTNPRKKARNVYFQIGHSASLFDNPDFVRMFVNAIRWGLSLPMLPDRTRQLETALAAIPLTDRQPIPLTGWTHRGEGRLSAEGDALVVTVPLHTGRRARGSEDDSDYAIYGTGTVSLPLGGQNLERWNRISFDIRSDLDAGIANMNIALDTQPYSGLGAHLVTMDNHGWQHVVYQLSELPRQRVEVLRLYTDIKGRNLSRHDSVRYEIRNLQWEQAGTTEPFCGWQVAAGRIAYSASGYLTTGSKTAITSGQAGRFRLIDERTGDIAYEGWGTKPVSTLDADLTVLDFTPFQGEGIFHIETGSTATAPFPIMPQALDGTAWKVLNFIRCQRCGAAVPGIHDKCHTDVFCEHDGRTLSYGGGWHDAGDLSQQTLQTGDVTYALLEAYETFRAKRPQLASLLLDEARHGIAQMVNTRFGDGWRASSIGLLHWTDGIAGTADDIHSVRKQHLAFDNYLYAAYEAYAAILLADDSLRQLALEDFQLADSQYQREGIDTFRITMEHTYNTSDATWMAAASWSASMLYRLTGEQAYADKAAQYIRYTLDCQEKEGGFAGFFYRDRSRRAIIHYIHQSREQLPVQALVALCEGQPGHKDYQQWRQAIVLYGNYLRQTAAYTQPYGMLPSGIYKEGEYADEDGFSRLHLWAPDNSHALYDEQLKAGVKVDDRHYVRRFPIWFSIFNGNEAVILSSGKAAALCGRFLGDEALMDLAREQLYWSLGKNPFCQSLIYGEGYRYPSMDSFSSGELTGEIPVGIRSYGHADIPYFPMTNNACYKEVWLTSAGKWLSLLADTIVE